MAGSIADLLPPPKGSKTYENAVVPLPEKRVINRAHVRSILKRPAPSVAEETRQRTQDAIDRILAGPELPLQSREVHEVAEKKVTVIPRKQDPLEPPRHRHFKPEKTIQDHAPVMRPEPAPLTKQQQVEWTVPPSVSNWKNPKSKVVPLDQRVHQPSSNVKASTKRHSKLASALHGAEALHQEETQIRAAERDRQRQDKLEELATRARTRTRPSLKRERDWAERSALGEVPAASKEVDFDSRLFNKRPRSENVLASSQAARALYRPGTQKSENTQLGPIEFEDADD